MQFANFLQISAQIRFTDLLIFPFAKSKTSNCLIISNICPGDTTGFLGIINIIEYPNKSKNVINCRRKCLCRILRSTVADCAYTYTHNLLCLVNRVQQLTIVIFLYRSPRAIIDYAQTSAPVINIHIL